MAVGATGAFASIRGSFSEGSGECVPCRGILPSPPPSLFPPSFSSPPSPSLTPPMPSPHPPLPPPSPLPPPLPFGDRLLDLHLLPLRPGEVTYVEGDTAAVIDLTCGLMISTLRSTKKKAVYVDGCVSMNPYRIARLCRRHRLNPRDVLARIEVARAFTVYQLSTIIENMLESVLPGVTLLIVQGMECMFRDDDIQPEEARVLLGRAFSRVKGLARRYGPVTVVTDVRRRGGRQLLPNSGAVRRRISFASNRKRLRVRDLTAGVAMDYAPLPWYQMIMDDFGEVR